MKPQNMFFPSKDQLNQIKHMFYCNTLFFLFLSNIILQLFHQNVISSVYNQRWWSNITHLTHKVKFSVYHPTTRWHSDTAVKQAKLSRCYSNLKVSFSLSALSVLFERSSFASRGQSDVTFMLLNHNRALQQGVELITITVWMMVL